MRPLVWLLFSLLGTCLLTADDNPFPEAPPEVEKALRGRVMEFYTRFQQRKYRQAEALVDEESRDYFYASSKKPIMSFELVSMEFGEYFQKAKVLVNVMVMLPMMGPRPVAFPLTGDWRWIEDNWYIHMASSKPGTIKQGPFGPMVINPEGAAAAGAYQGMANYSPKTVKQSLRKMYHVEPNTLRFPQEPSQPITHTVRFINPGPARLSVSATNKTHTLPGLKIEFDGRKVEPGEKLPITFTYQAKKQPLQGKYDIVFSVLPLKQQFAVTVSFAEQAESGAGLRLAALGRKDDVQYSLTQTASGSSREVIVSSTGQTIRIVPGAMLGFVDTVRRRQPSSVRLSGWASDMSYRMPAAKILIFVEGESDHPGHSATSRPDLVKAFGPALKQAGFGVRLPASVFERRPPREVRVFAISSEKGVASELRYGKSYLNDVQTLSEDRSLRRRDLEGR